MADSIKFDLAGVPEVQSALQAVKTALTAPELRKVYLAAARIVRDVAKRNAPRGKFSRNPGLLKRSITTFASKTRDKERQAAITWASVFKGAVRAPHAHLVEFGTKGPRIGKSGKPMRFRTASGQWVSAKVVAAMPASRFFQRAVQSHGRKAIDFALRETELVIQNRWTSVKKFALGVL